MSIDAQPRSAILENLALNLFLPAGLVVLVLAKPPLLLPIAFTCIAIASMHGAMDLAILLRRFPTRAAVAWAVLYAAAALAGYFFYQAYSRTAAVLFLLISAWHFAPFNRPVWLRFTSGICLIIAPFLFHPEAILWLGLPQLSAPLWLQIMWALLGAACVFAQKESTELCWRFAVYCGMAVWLHPLLWFALYFSFEHSLRHVSMLRQQQLADASAIALGALALFLVAAFGYFFIGLSSLQQFLEQHLACLIFAITVPHVLLVDFSSKYWLKHAHPESVKID